MYLAMVDSVFLFFALAFDIWTLYARHVLVLHWTFLCVLAPYGVVHFNNIILF